MSICRCRCCGCSLTRFAPPSWPGWQRPSSVSATCRTSSARNRPWSPITCGRCARLAWWIASQAAGLPTTASPPGPWTQSRPQSAGSPLPVMPRCPSGPGERAGHAPLLAHHEGPRPLMSDVVTERAVDSEGPVVARLATLAGLLAGGRLGAMDLGLLAGRALPGLDDALDAVEIGSVSLPIAVGLLLMMYPVLAKVRYTELGTVTGDRRMLVLSLVLNW